MIRVDLQIPVETSIKTSFAKRGAGLLAIVQDPAVVGVFLVAILTFVFALVLGHRADVRYETLESSVQSAVRDSARFEEDLRTADQLRAKRGRIERRISAIARIDQNRFAFVHVLDQIAAALISDVWLEQVTTNSIDASGRVRFSLTGYAPSNEIANLYLTQLEHSPFITNVALQGTNTMPLNGHNVVQFVISAQTEVPDQSFILTETIRPDGTRTSDLDQMELIVEEVRDSVVMTAPDSANLVVDNPPPPLPDSSTSSDPPPSDDSLRQ